VVEEKLQKKEQQQKTELKQKLIAGYQARTKQESLQKMLQTYGEMSAEDLSSVKLAKQGKKDGKHNK
jgi:hypothetical protein